MWQVIVTVTYREIHEFYKLNQELRSPIECLFLLDKAEIPEELCDIPGERVYVSSLVMKKLAGVQSTESIEVIALMTMPKSFVNLSGNHQEMDCMKWFHCSSAHRILVLEGIQVNSDCLSFLFFDLENFCCNWNDFILLQQYFNLNSIVTCWFPQDPGNLGTLLRSALAFKWVRKYSLSCLCSCVSFSFC